MAYEDRRLAKLLPALAVLALACSPPGIAGDDEIGEGGSESGSGDAIDGGTGSEDESTGGESVGSEDSGDDDGWGPSCAGGTGGGGAFLDVCPPEDACEGMSCPQGCVSGICMAGPALDACEPGLIVGEPAFLELGVMVHELHFAELDDDPGEELLIVYEGGVMVWDGAELHDTPFVGTHVQAAMFRLDDDGVDDLSLWAGIAGEPIYAAGDGLAGFGPSAPVDTKADTPLYRSPVAVDFDGDGFDELAALDGSSAAIWPNLGGSLGLSVDNVANAQRLASIELDGSLGEELVTLSPILTGDWIDGVDGEFQLAGALPDGPVPTLGDGEHQLGFAVVGDLNGDDDEDLLLGFRDSYRSGLRVWWGTAGAGFTAPVDQELEEFQRPRLIRELDGSAPAELVLAVGGEISFARAELDLGLPLGCRSTLELAGERVAVGDVNGDGVLELASSLADGVSVATVMSE